MTSSYSTARTYSAASAVDAPSLCENTADPNSVANRCRLLSDDDTVNASPKSTWAAFAALMSVFGVLYGYGVVLEPISDEFGVGRGAAGALPAMGSFVLFGFGPISGRLADRHGTHTVVAAAAVLLAVGLGTVAVTHTYVVALIAFGLGVGLACGLAYVPSVAHIAASTDPRTPRRVGIAVAGVGVGTAAGSTFVDALIGRLGWRATYGWVAVFGVIMLLASAAVFRTDRLAGERSVELPRVSALVASGPFRRHYLAMVMMTPSVFVGLVFVASYGEEQGWSSARAASLLSLIGVAGVIGRVGIAAAAERLSAESMYRSCYVVLAASCALWAVAGSTYTIMVVYAVLMGIAYGGFIGLAPLVAARAFGRVGLGGTLGGLYTAIGLGGLATGPVAGVLIDGVGYPVTLLTIAALATGALFVLPATPRARGMSSM